jgi:hypothetical protein
VTPEQAAHETRDAIVGLPARFMTEDPGRFGEASTKHGFAGMDFYVAGRAGVLGDAPADVAVAALVFFAPGVVHEAWARSATVMAHRAASEAWAALGHEWAEATMSDEHDWATIAGLAGRIVASAPVAGAPLFAGWRTLPEPESPKALAQHRLNVLRELRGGLHGAAVLTVGLAPVEAIVVRTPQVLPLFGWPEPYPEAGPLHERWALAEARTDRMFGRNFAVLDADERQLFVDLLKAATQ